MVVREKAVKKIIQRSGLTDSEYSANPYIGCPHQCRYCYASGMMKNNLHREPWGQYLDIKLWDTSTQLIGSSSSLVIGTVTDPYNPYEEKYCATRKLLLQLLGTNSKITVITKSDLVLRDIDILLKLPNVRVAVSLNTLDENFRLDMDKATSVERRLYTIRTLHSCGIPTVCFVAPIFPKLTDVPEIIYTVKDYCDEIWVENLNLSGSCRSNILSYIMERYPEYMRTYDAIYGNRNYTYWHQLETQIEGLCSILGLPYRKGNQQQGDYNIKPLVVNYFYHASQRWR